MSTPRPIFLRLRRGFPWRSAISFLAGSVFTALWLGLDLVRF